VSTNPNILVAVVDGDRDSSLTKQLLSLELCILSGSVSERESNLDALCFGAGESDLSRPTAEWVWIHEHPSLSWIESRIKAGGRTILGASGARELNEEALQLHDGTSWYIDFSFCAPDFSIDQAADILAVVLEKAGRNSEREQKKLRVVALEALTNAWEHGYGGDENQKIHAIYRVGLDSFHIEISHQGLGFDVNDVPDPMAPENLLSESGRGILIMKNTLDRLEYKDGGRKLVGYKSFKK
jgi:serine/threonine-protein kinase RsbW